MIFGGCRINNRIYVRSFYLPQWFTSWFTNEYEIDTQPLFVWYINWHKNYGNEIIGWSIISPRPEIVYQWNNLTLGLKNKNKNPCSILFVSGERLPIKRFYIGFLSILCSVFFLSWIVTRQFRFVAQDN